jgi:hypothetical protein
MDGHPQPVHRIRSRHRYTTTGTVDGSRITGPYIRLVRVTVASPTIGVGVLCSLGVTMGTTEFLINRLEPLNALNVLRLGT